VFLSCVFPFALCLSLSRVCTHTSHAWHCDAFLQAAMELDLTRQECETVVAAREHELSLAMTRITDLGECFRSGLALRH
jgi:hypothetical protein